MAVDAAAFPYLKTSFGPPGQRSYAYIGRDDLEKGTDILAEVFRRLPYSLHYYGTVNPNSPLLGLGNIHLHGWTDLNHEWMHDFARQCDFVVATGRSDANPTSLLEGAAWGLIPLASQECGYYIDAGDSQPAQLHVGGLSIHNLDFTVQRLCDYNLAPEQDLLARSQLNRHLIESVYSWDRFCATVLSVLARWL
jgi:glycosyltransferase involved in cell wall biosynthesis